MPERLSARLLPAWVDPVAVFRSLEAAHADVFWLDAGADARTGWSFIGRGTAAELPSNVRLDVAPPDARLPPFAGGWVGWLDYESGARAVGAPVFRTDEAGSWLRATHVVAFDHAARQSWVLADADDLEAWTSVVATMPIPAPGFPPVHTGAPLIAEARHDPEEYAGLIQRCRELIRAGIAYQLCLTTRFSVPGEHDPLLVYLRLRAATPAHHGGFVRIGQRVLLSASPEQFLHAEGGVIRTRPIKGTRPRSVDPVEDAALAAELAVNSKERAENVMIVDLMRNDLSRVCVPGTIRVDGLWVVESYPAVHQLVSTVSGSVAAGMTVGSLLEAAFPAGSMTGAPKLSAMTRLHDLEGGPRGIYAGCFGYVGIDGSLDLAMVIRSIVIDADAAVVGAGGGITWGSDPSAEVAEVATKARAPLAALGAVLPVRWGSDILN
ncbi:anthranilate synthase component I family protein [Microbacterium sp. SSW1-49]|uniref:Anthranilate synthase component I family protein n=1 Tax=Microbacterium croceum TaxID=2851645 RepID=A0ABT0FG66_9MICO|nr:anthranilate synthase component I family protein [Microbacterium croceum]MCK2037061.1 anthranilate synthase component I family protein [Microbacterium croceum]